MPVIIPRCYDELVEILWLTKELPWLVESGEFSLYLFGIYHELYSWKIILRDVLKCDKPLRHYDKYLLLLRLSLRFCKQKKISMELARLYT